MGKFAKELGFFIISVFLVCIPFLTGLRLGTTNQVDFFTFCGVMLAIGEVLYLTVTFICEHE